MPTFLMKVKKAKDKIYSKPGMGLGRCSVVMAFAVLAATVRKGVTYVLVGHYGLPVILVTGKLKTCKTRSLCKPTLSINSWFR